VNIQGTAGVLDPVTFKITAGGACSCAIPNTGEFSIGPDIMATLPAGAGFFSFHVGGSRNVQYQ
jgi:hypothetical protein